MVVPGIATHYANHAAPLLPNGLQDTVAARNHRAKSRRWRRVGKTAAFAAQLAVLALIGLLIIRPGAITSGTMSTPSTTSTTSARGTLAGALLRSTTTGSNGGGTVTLTTTPPHTLVIYVYADTDPEYINNLRFFVKHGIRPGDGCDYIIVIQQDPAPAMTQVLPELPENARYKFHVNECFDWGTIGWVLEQADVDTSDYSYFVLMNSSVRGPLLPAYWPPALHWASAFTGRLSDTVKIVGPTISCEGSPRNGDPTAPWRRNPHVQSYVVATDKVGLGILQRDGKVLECHRTIHDAIWHAELGSSAAILNAGYGLDCLMWRYQGVDWQDHSNWGCNGGLNPYMALMNSGISLDPFEVMFVKVKAHFIDLGWSYARAAAKYDTWMAGGDGSSLFGPSRADVTANEGVAEAAFLKLPMTLAMAARGPQCFDVDYYMRRNADIPEALGRQPGAAWDHFVNYGQWEGRPFSFTCGVMKRMMDARAKSSQPRGGADAAVEELPGARLFGRAAASTNHSNGAGVA